MIRLICLFVSVSVIDDVQFVVSNHLQIIFKNSYFEHKK